MSNLIDRLTNYFDRKGDSLGQWYTRCLIGLLLMGSIAGLLAGFAFALCVCGIHQVDGQHCVVPTYGTAEGNVAYRSGGKVCPPMTIDMGNGEGCKTTEAIPRLNKARNELLGGSA